VELIHIENPNFEIMQKIIELEESAFEGAGNVDLWIIKALIRYGMVFVVKEGDKIIVKGLFGLQNNDSVEIKNEVK